jgi:hypothetical protein
VGGPRSCGAPPRTRGLRALPARDGRLSSRRHFAVGGPPTAVPALLLPGPHRFDSPDVVNSRACFWSTGTASVPPPAAGFKKVASSLRGLPSGPSRLARRRIETSDLHRSPSMLATRHCVGEPHLGVELPGRHGVQSETASQLGRPMPQRADCCVRTFKNRCSPLSVRY